MSKNLELNCFCMCNKTTTAALNEVHDPLVPRCIILGAALTINLQSCIGGSNDLILTLTKLIVSIVFKAINPTCKQYQTGD